MNVAIPEAISLTFYLPMRNRIDAGRRKRQKVGGDYQVAIVGGVAKQTEEMPMHVVSTYGTDQPMG